MSNQLIFRDDRHEHRLCGYASMPTTEAIRRAAEKVAASVPNVAQPSRPMVDAASPAPESAAGESVPEVSERIQ